MSNVGSAAAGKTLIGAGNGASPTFASIGTNSGLTAHGVLLAEGNSAFVVAVPGASGTILMSNGIGSDPSFQTGGTVFANTITGDTGGALAPVAGNWFILGSVLAPGTSPVQTAGSGNTLVVNIQRSQAIAAADSTKVGLANFDSSSFAVAATGFVTLSTTGAGKTITGDSGGALSPTANNWNILGGPGVTTSGSGSTLTINSVVFTDTTAITLVSDNGYFATAAGTYVLPATPAQGELIIVVCDTAGAVVVDAPSTHLIRVGNQITSAGGTMTSTAIGDSLTLRYRASSTTWEATSVIGNWTPA